MFPKSKIMQLREELTKGESASRTFAIEMAARGRDFPVIPGLPQGENLWSGNKTPYFDMVELIEFYPFLKWIPGNNEAQPLSIKNELNIEH